MSDSSFSTPPSLAGASPLVAGPGRYQLSDELARLCLPQEFKDNCKVLAWVNSICFLFFLVGLVGLKAPRVIHKPLSQPTELVPVVFTPPEEPPKTEPDTKPDETERPQDTPTDVPQVATVVAAADAPDVAFAVPVQGAVAVLPTARFAPPPPTKPQAPPAQPVRFNPSAAGAGTYPPPEYPPQALRNHYQGTVTIEIMVDASGGITSLKVQKSSGYAVLDEAALEVVKRRWRFPPGGTRYYYWPCIFQMN